MTNRAPLGWLKTTARVACLLLATVTLSGCIVLPYPGYHHPRYWYRY